MDAGCQRHGCAAQGKAGGNATKPLRCTNVGAKIRHEIKLVKTVKRMRHASPQRRQIVRHGQRLVERERDRRPEGTETLFVALKQTCLPPLDRDPF